MANEGITFELRNGHRIPAVGLGMWKAPKDVAVATVREALLSGYRHIDCAASYGNEAEVGVALSQLVGEGADRPIRRGDVFVTTKLWNDCHHSADVRPACLKSLSNLQLSYIDLYLMHWPYALKKGYPTPWSAEDLDSDVTLAETWHAMEDLVKDGLVRAIGICNVSQRRLNELLTTCVRSVPPSVVQVELHPYLPQTGLIDLCARNGIHVTAYSALGSGDRPRRGASEPVLLQDDVLADVAAAHSSATAAGVALRWGVQRGTSVLAKSVTPSRIRENVKAGLKRGSAGAIDLSDAEMARITALGTTKPKRYVEHTLTTDDEHVPDGHVQWLWE